MKCDESGMGRDESGALGTNRANLGTNQRRRGVREEFKRSPDRSGRSQPRRKDTTVELVKFGDARSTAAVLVVKGCMVLIMLPKKTFPGGKKVTE
jgi:hypothetical protein